MRKTKEVNVRGERKERERERDREEERETAHDSRLGTSASHSVGQASQKRDSDCSEKRAWRPA